LKAPRQVKFVVPTAVNTKIAVLGRLHRVLWEMNSGVSEEPVALSSRTLIRDAAFPAETPL